MARSLVFLTALLLLPGCGDDSSNGTTSDGSTAPATTGASTGAASSSSSSSDGSGTAASSSGSGGSSSGGAACPCVDSDEQCPSSPVEGQDCGQDVGAFCCDLGERFECGECANSCGWFSACTM